MHRAGRRLTLAAIATMAAAPRVAQWQPDEFMISLWGCPDTPERARAVAGAGFNTVMCPAEHLDLCHRHGRPGEGALLRFGGRVSQPSEGK
ncbi:MAG: hypothetical protein U9R79_11290 [Armatimonadota bacterium]|nr:hypothetical protein [Armatimonadota bacterium]